LAGLILDHAVDWLKLDFNLDPGAGCNRTDHGHGAGAGLYAQVAGYYTVLERLREAFPRVALENCASGGLRLDLGLMRRTDIAYLSDPDWPEHSLQVFWGASTMLAADRLLHWAFSEWRPIGPPPKQNFDPHAPGLTRQQWDYYARIAMLGAFGLSHKLPTLPAWLAQRLTEQIHLYKTVVARFVREGDLYRLTEQPRRDGTGERWAAFQHSLPDKSEHLLFVFRLPGAEAQRAIRLLDLEPECEYSIVGLEGERAQTATGHDLMLDGIWFTDLLEEDSALLRIRC
jgi:alpha-galactosidase